MAALCCIMAVSPGGSFILLCDSDGVYSDRYDGTQTTDQNFPLNAAPRIETISVIFTKTNTDAILLASWRNNILYLHS